MLYCAGLQEVLGLGLPKLSVLVTSSHARSAPLVASCSVRSDALCYYSSDALAPSSFFLLLHAQIVGANFAREVTAVKERAS